MLRPAQLNIFCHLQPVYPSSVDFVNLNLDLGFLAELRVPIWLHNCPVEVNDRDGEVLGKVFCMLKLDDEEVNVRIEGGKFNINAIEEGNLISLEDCDVCSTLDVLFRAIKRPVELILNEVSVNSELLCQHSRIIKNITVL